VLSLASSKLSVLRPGVVKLWQSVAVASPRPLVATLIATALVIYTTQTMLVPVLAPLTRLLHAPESALGASMTVSAAMMAVVGPWWARRVDRIGVKKVLLIGMGVALLGLVSFALFVAVATRVHLHEWLIVVGLVLTRGLLWGLGMAAVPVAAITFLASITPTASERTKVIGALGAAQGISLVLGPAIGGGLGLVALLLPVYLAPFLLAAMLVVIVLLPAPTRIVRDEPVRLRITDRRIRPFVLAGGAMLLGLGLVEIVLGFLVQDRLGLSEQETAGVVGLAGVVIGVVFAATQAFVAPRTRWAPRTLIAVGSLIAAAGYLAAVFAPTLWTLLPSMAGVAVGMGMALPGYGAGATLAVEDFEHAAISGVLTATAGVAYVFGPIVGTLLYQVVPTLPIWGAATLAVVSATAMRIEPVSR
jgi:MFS transporter, DHA1 family, tetracycline resistance protein